MMKRILLCMWLGYRCICTQGSDLDSLRQVLIDEIDRKHVYEEEKRNDIDVLRKLLQQKGIDQEQRYRYHQLMITEFAKYSFDSTMYHIEASIEIALVLDNPSLLNESYITLANNLQNVGRSKEAEDALKNVTIDLLTREEVILVRNIERKLFENLSYYASTIRTRDFYEEKYGEYKNLLSDLLDKEAEVYLEIKEKELLDKRELDSCLWINSQRLDGLTIDDPGYATLTFSRSLIYDLLGDHDKRIENLMLSAISDIRLVVKDNASLAMLAKILYDAGDIELANKFIQSAYEDAVSFNSGLRFIELSNTLAAIAASYQALSVSQKSRLEKNLLVISSLAVLLFILTVLVVRQVKTLSRSRQELDRSLHNLNRSNQQLLLANEQLEKLNVDLSESNIVKEHYIATFLNIHSEYIDKIDKYQKLVKKMLLGRKFEQLLEQINSRKFVDAEIKNFYETFDRAFLDIYPGFIDQLNALLKSGEAIELKEGELLNTELRIFALIRLGIQDSSTIARLLRYSVNTIYNYRVKIKNKATSREEFESQVLQIHSSHHD